MVAVVLLASLPMAGRPALARPALARSAAVVAVDAAASLGALNNPAWYMNQTRAFRPGELARQQEIGPSRVVRVWVKPDHYHDPGTGSYDFARAYNSLDSAAANSDLLFANVDQCDQELMTPSAPQACRAVLKETIRHFKLRYPTLRYIELFNEPDKTWPVGPEEKPAIPVDQYYEWFRVGYSVVNELNAELNPELPIAIGGPAAYTLNAAWLGAFLDRFRADQDRAKRLDFISYHEYSRRANPAEAGTARSTVRAWLAERGLDPGTPLFITEYGVFPGGPESATGQGTTYEEDLLTHAAAMSTLGTYFAGSGVDMPMHWVYDHPTNDRKSMFVDAVDGAVHPYYNVVKMQSMLKRSRVRSGSSGLTAAGLGVNALATADGTGVAVLTTNYQWTTGATEYDVRMDVSNLPARFAGLQVLVERYLVDATTSNYAHDPATSTLQRVQRYVLPAGSAASVEFPLSRNAVSLVTLTPVVHAEAESLPATASPGDAVQAISDTAAIGGRLSKLGADAPGDYAQYTLPVPRAGRYRIVARLKHSPDRGIVQPTVGGIDQGGPMDTASIGYAFAEVDLGPREFAAAGSVPFRFTMVGTSSGGYTLGVDGLTLLPLP